MTKDRIGHYEPLTKNNYFQWIHLKMSKYKKNNNAVLEANYKPSY